MIGVFGGTFDPVHFGHLRLAEELADALAVREVRFLPVGHPPHRPPPATPAAHRVEMLRLALAGNPRLVVDAREVRRPGPAYTVETLDELRAELGTEAPLCLFLGWDAFAGFASWKDWRRIFGLAHLAVAKRGTAVAPDDLSTPKSSDIPGNSSIPDSSSTSGAAAGLGSLTGELRAEAERRRAEAPADLGDRPAGRLWLHAMTPLAISSTQIRRLLQNGDSPRYLLPDAVLDHVRQHRLYSP